MLKPTCLLISFFFNFLSISEAAVCNIGKECVPLSNYNGSSITQLSILERKWTKEFCVFFQCIVDGGKVMKGAGLFEDFENVCKDVDSSTKEMLKSRNGTYWDNNLIFAQCNNADLCNTNSLINENVDQIDAYFGKNVSTLSGKAVDETCHLNLTCDHESSCMEAALFGHGFPWDNTKQKTCRDACVRYYCLYGNGFGKLGFGCYEDFLNDCPNLNPKIKEKIEANLPRFEYGDGNVIFFSCNHEDGCAKAGIGELIVETDHGEVPYPNECSDGITTTSPSESGTMP